MLGIRHINLAAGKLHNQTFNVVTWQLQTIYKYVFLELTFYIHVECTCMTVAFFIKRGGLGT
jgi:hypothetical protein